MKKNSKSPTKKEQTSKRTRLQRPRGTKEVLAELVERLRGKLELKAMPASPGQVGQQPELRPNLDRLTVGVDLGDQWSHYCILGLQGETLSEGQVRTTQAEVEEFFQAITPARVVMEVGTHSAWVQEIIAGCGHEVLVANPRLMEGSKRRKRKNDRIDANKLARLGRVDPQSLHPIEHRSREVRQDLVLLRAREALVAVRTELINTTRGLVKSLGTRLPKCSSRSFGHKVGEAIPEEVREALLPLVQLAEGLSACIQGYDRRIEELASEKYGHTKILRQVKGVGPLTSLAYVLTLEKPERFAKSRDVGPYLGLDWPAEFVLDHDGRVSALQRIGCPVDALPQRKGQPYLWEGFVLDLHDGRLCISVIDRTDCNALLQALRFVRQFADCRRSVGERLSLVVAVNSEARRRLYVKAASHTKVQKHAYGAAEPVSAYRVSLPVPSIHSTIHESNTHTDNLIRGGH